MKVIILLAAGGVETTNIDDTLLNDMFNKFLENDLFNFSVFEANVLPIKTRTFKSKGNNEIVTFIEQTYVIRSYKENCI